MKKLTVIFTALIVLCSATATQPAFAYARGSHPSWDTTTYTHDSYGSLTRRDNMYKDSDGDGVVNAYDRNDRNRSSW